MVRVNPIVVVAPAARDDGVSIPSAHLWEQSLSAATVMPRDIAPAAVISASITSRDTRTLIRPMASPLINVLGRNDPNATLRFEAGRVWPATIL